MTVTIVMLSNGERFPIAEINDYIPDAWLCRYCSVALRTAGLSINTMIRYVGAVVLLNSWALSRHIDVTARIESGDLFTQEESLDLLNWLRKSRAKPKLNGNVKTVVDANTHENRVISVRSYIRWRGEIAVHRIPVASGRYGDASKKLAD